ncbi:MAG: DinB family protein [Candidatus Hodarchaeales archaeon]|jgi:uncharacterized damage-inducible protein DinB
MRPLDKALTMIPNEKLNFKPTDDSMTISDLGSHIYRGTLALTGGALTGEFTNDDFRIIPFDQEKVSSTKEIVEFGQKVKEYIRNSLEKLTEEDLDKEVTFTCWGGFKVTANHALETIIEETIHHRGQLCVYLRMMGIKPPQIYDYS